MKLNTILELDGFGIFQAIKGLHPEPSGILNWLSLEDAIELDNMYLFHSGKKEVTARFKAYITKFEGDVEQALNQLAKHVSLMYANSWDRIHLALTQEYNPLENYDSTESEKVGSKVTSTVTSDNTSSTTSNSNGNGTNSNKTYGFNSVDAVPTGEGSSTASSNGTSNVVAKDSTTSVSEGLPEDNSRELRRHGNIGVTTSAQMLTGEMEVRMKYHLFDILMNDVDKILCLRVY